MLHMLQIFFAIILNTLLLNKEFYFNIFLLNKWKKNFIQRAIEKKMTTQAVMKKKMLGADIDKNNEKVDEIP